MFRRRKEREKEKAEIREALKKQLKLLSESSEKSYGPEYVELASAMVKITEALQSVL